MAGLYVMAELIGESVENIMYRSTDHWIESYLLNDPIQHTWVVMVN